MLFGAFCTCEILPLKKKKFKTGLVTSFILLLDILFFNEDFDKVTLIACQRHILAADLEKINLHNDNNFDENDPYTIFITDF